MTQPFGCKWRGTKEPLESERGEWKKLANIQKTKIMTSGPITSYQIDGETVETVRNFIFLGSQITADDDCSHEIKRCLLLGRNYDQLRQHIKQQRHYFADNGPSSQSYGFLVVMYGCESWTIKKAWVPKNWCFRICGAREDSWESFGQQGDQTSQS